MGIGINSNFLGKTVYTQDVHYIDIIDTGSEVHVKGATNNGRISVWTDATTTGVVESMRLVMYPYVTLAGTKNELDHLRSVNSYAKCLTALMASEVVVNNVPFPTVLSMLTHIELGQQADPTKMVPTAPDGVIVYGPHATTFAFSTDDDGNPGNPEPVANRKGLGIHLPESSDFEILFNTPYHHPDRAIGDQQGSITWPGLLQIQLKNTTKLGSLSIQS